ncbi:MAG TPA: VWA domain-containing protein [Terriglobia bacterium]|nr:VWA domain-containing protein [Terriglobia bacterium]
MNKLRQYFSQHSKRIFRVFLIPAALLSLAACLAMAQQKANINLPAPQQAPQTPEQTLQGLARIHVQSTLVEAPVTVVDSQGNYVQNLSQSDFEVLDNGVPQNITRFGLATQPVALVIVVQTNQTVDPLLYQVRPLGSLFSGLFLGTKGEAAVICFDDNVRVVQNFTSDPNTLDAALRHIDSVGTRTRLNDALARAILMLSQRPSSERRVILVFSEGLNSGSQTSREEIIRAATAADVAIYGMRFEPESALLKNKQEAPAPDPIDTNMARPGPPGRPQTPDTNQSYWNPWNTPTNGLPLMTDTLNVLRSARFKDIMDAYSKYTGGQSFGNWKQSSFQNRLQKIALDVNSQYMLAYAPSTLKQTGFHRLVVRVREPGLKTRARAGYFYMTPAAK